MLRNDQRAERAAAALDTVYSQDREGVTDLLADLMHYADRERIDFEQALKTARHHHQTETTEATSC